MQHLIMMAGLPGVGKSTLSKTLGEKLGYNVHSLRGVRRELGFKEYNPEDNKIALPKLHNEVLSSLYEQQNVIIDNNFTLEKGRKKYYEIGSQLGIDTIILEVVCSEEEAKRRMKLRPESDGLFEESRDPKVYDQLKDRWQNISRDENTFLEYNVSYVQYNSETKEFDNIYLNKRAIPIVESINKIITEHF